MVGIQTISARIGRVTGDGLAANIRRHYPAWLLAGLVGLLLIANTSNIAADIGAMGAALKLLSTTLLICMRSASAWCRCSCKSSYRFRATPRF